MSGGTSTTTARRHRDGLVVCLGIATVGRADVLAETVRDIARQTRPPDLVVICHVTPADIAGVDTHIAAHNAAGGLAVEFMMASAGLPRQRNAILRRAAACDVVLFVDDDFLMAPRYIEVVATALRYNAGVVAATGALICDASRGPGLSVAAGRALIAADAAAQADKADISWRAAPHGYGCNMALRMRTVRDNGMAFDERLPLYAWSEDIDFTHRIARHGTIAKLQGARGVHLGAKQARSPGRRLGYSQVANPIYLLGKGSYSRGRAGRSVARNIAANCARALWPEPYIDRRGRLLGNAMALLDLCRGRMQPERILDL